MTFQVRGTHPLFAVLLNELKTPFFSCAKKAASFFRSQALSEADELHHVTDEALLGIHRHRSSSGILPTHLSQLATTGELRKNLVAEVDLMLADPRARRFVTLFVDQWLNLNLVDNIAIARDCFPDFNDRLKQDAQRATGKALRNRRSLRPCLSPGCIGTGQTSWWTLKPCQHLAHKFNGRRLASYPPRCLDS